ncbi:MAG: antibiotic biosynthesis monooxygenase [Bacteroidaceae bacterium]|nr:antibiotic biosynthesis monooxygenase [Bacteroidaceae bacterium]
MTSCKDSGNEVPDVDVVLAKEGNIRFNGMMTVDAANRAEVIALSKQLIEETKLEEGVIDYDVMASVTRPNKVLLYQTWENEECFKRHRASKHVTTIIPKVMELCQVDGRTFTIKGNQEIDGEKPFRFNVLMTSETPERYINIVEDVIVGTREKDEGVIEYDLFESLTTPGSLLLLEVWKNKISLVGHLNSSHFIKARKKTKGLLDKTQFIARMQEE